jgi:hypothetical protein
MRFLTGDEITSGIRKALKSAANCDLAVAYWGSAGPEMLQLEPTSTIRILCDAYSGACSPKAFLALLAMPNVTIKSRARLHAKLYLTESVAVVGSANASANGLGEENEEVGKIEAAVEFGQPAELAKAKTWFEGQWSHGDAKLITGADIAEITRAWLPNRAGRPTRSKANSSQSFLLADPRVFADRRIRVIVYDFADVSQEARRQFREQARELYSKKEIAAFKGNLPIYEDDGRWDITEGEYVIDYHYEEESNRLVSGGMWKVLRVGPRHKGSRLVHVQSSNKAYGVSFSRQDQVKLGKALSRYVIPGKKPKPNRAGNLVERSLDSILTELASESYPSLTEPLGSLPSFSPAPRTSPRPSAKHVGRGHRRNSRQ